MGQTNQMVRSGANPAAKADLKSGQTVDPGPYEAIVTGHVAGSRMGELQVYIPEWGGLQTDPDQQISVSYASPFYGVTFGTDSQQLPTNSWATAGQSYGMFMVPPDVGNKVLVTFIRGDLNRGYWFACCYDSTSHHMVPNSTARNIGGNSSQNTRLDSTAPAYLANEIGSNSIMPVVEYDTGLSSAFSQDALVQTPRFINTYQASILINQGLDRDPVRGAISSSSMREAPSQVFGISTPGKSLTGNKPQVTSDIQVEANQAVIGRTGGHSFVMDDGALNADNVSDGTDQLIRLRTSGGHQILMNDTQQVLYIASATGMQWLEFSNDGSINVYGKNGINVRTEGVMNLQGDAAIIMNSQGPIQINGDKGISMTTKSSMSLSAEVSLSLTATAMASLKAGGVCSVGAGGIMNVGSAGITNISGSLTNLTGTAGAGVSIATPVKYNNLPTVALNGGLWTFNAAAQQTICSVAPCHEPWVDPDMNTRPAPQFPSSGGVGSIITNALGGAALGSGAGAATTAVNSFFS
jgi:hypothetical protein